MVDQPAAPEAAVVAAVSFNLVIAADSKLRDDPVCREGAGLERVLQQAITAWAVCHDMEVARLQVAIVYDLACE
jgi:hypothetical protein